MAAPRNEHNAGIPPHSPLSDDVANVRDAPIWERIFRKLKEFLDMIFEDKWHGPMKTRTYFEQDEAERGPAVAAATHDAYNDALKLRQAGGSPAAESVTEPGFNPLASNALAKAFGPAAIPGGNVIDPDADQILGRIGPADPSILGRVA